MGARAQIPDRRQGRTGLTGDRASRLTAGERICAEGLRYMTASMPRSAAMHLFDSGDGRHLFVHPGVGTSRVGARLGATPEVTILAPDQIETIRDATHLLEDQQDVTPMGLAYQAIELGTSTSVLDGSLRRVVKAMRP